MSLILLLLSFDGFVISYDVSIVICFNIHFPPMHADIQNKLFMVARKSRKKTRNDIRDEKSFSSKNISSCVLYQALVLWC